MPLYTVVRKRGLLNTEEVTTTGEKKIKKAYRISCKPLFLGVNKGTRTPIDDSPKRADTRPALATGLGDKDRRF